MSELMRQKLMSVSPVHKRAGGVRVQHANASVDRTQNCPMLDRTSTDSVIFAIRSESVSRGAVDCFSSRTLRFQTLDQSERKLLRFEERVEQFRAVDFEDAQKDWDAESDDDSSNEGLLMRFPLKKPPFPQGNTGRKSGTNSKIIAKLPPTTLKSPSPSAKKTLGRFHPSTNSLLDEEGDTGISSVRLSKFLEAPDDFVATHDGGAAKHGEKRLLETAVDMFIPFKDDQDDTVAAGVVNRLINTLHMGIDVAQVIWTDGWFQFLERLLIQCSSILLALLDANEQP
jgi:hypothetical protein